MRFRRGKMSRFCFISLLVSLLVLAIADAWKYKPSDALEPIKKFREKRVDNTSLVDILLQPSFIDEDGIPVSNITTACKAVLVGFAEQSSRFTKCLLNNARPFRMCEKCVEHYTRATNLYSDLTRDNECSALLLLADRMQVMSSIYNMFSDLWTGADCGMCFTSIQENSTTAGVTFSFTAETIMFQDKHNNMSLCVNHSAEWDWNGIDYKNGSECTACLDIYKDLNSQFEDMRKKADGHVCMDVVDMMNYTRLMWSAKYGCQRPSADTKFVIILSCLLGFFTMVLYLSSRFNAKIRLPKIFKAKRMVGVTQYGTVNQDGFTDSVTSMPFSSPASPVNSNTHVG